MGYQCCFSCMKYLVFTVNFLVLLIGLLILGFSSWLLTYEQLYADPQSVYYVYCILLTLGILVFFVSFLACCGSIRESSCLLAFFFVVVLLLFLAEITLGLYIYFEESILEQAIGVNVDQTVTEKYTNGTYTAKVWDLIQNQLECCGGEGPLDWARSRYSGYEETREIGIGGSKFAPFLIPDSCCSSNSSCEGSVDFNADFNSLPYYTKGCTGALVVVFEDNLFYILIGGLAVLFLEVMAMLMSLCMCTTIRKIERSKN